MEASGTIAMSVNIISTVQIHREDVERIRRTEICEGARDKRGMD
jgi:hypothetical protein